MGRAYLPLTLALSPAGGGEGMKIDAARKFSTASPGGVKTVLRRLTIEQHHSVFLEAWDDYFGS